MKINNSISLVIQSILLMLMPVISLSAGTVEDEAGERARVAAIINQTAKTPEEFMKRVQQVWSKPEMRIQEVAEIITGAQLKWFKSDPVGLPGIIGSGLFIEYEDYPTFPYGGGFYDSDSNQIDPWTGKKRPDRFGLHFKGETRRDNPRRILCVTAALVKKVIGEPHQVNMRVIRADNGKFQYFYTAGKRTITFEFNGTKGRRDARHLFENHKNVCLAHFIIDQER